MNRISKRLRDIFGADLRSLALLRMSLGIIVFADLIDRSRDLRAHYTDWGLLPRGPLVTKFMNEWTTCLHLSTGTTAGTIVLFLLQALVALGLLVGFRTRLMTVLSWFLMYSLHLRNPVVLQGGDDLLRMLLFWGMFVPLGARYSVDAALSRGDPTTRFTPPPSQLFSLGTVALVAQILVLYWCTALLKSGAEWHSQGTAVYFALNFDQLATSTGVWLRQFTSILPFLTHSTIIFETFGPFLLISPFAFGPVRTLGALMFMGMHHCFALCLILGLFPWIDTASMLMLLPGWFWDKVSAWIPKEQDQVTLYFDDGCEVCRKLVLIVTEFLLVQRVVCEPVNTSHKRRASMDKNHSWLVQDAQGEHHGFDAFVALCRVSPLGRPFAKFLGTGWRSKFGERAYRMVSTHRPRAAYLLSSLKRGTPVNLKTSIPVSCVLAFLIYLMVSWNMAGLHGSGVGFYPALRPLAYSLRLDQDWGMFAPFPSKEDGWYVTGGTLMDGTPVDVYAQTRGQVSYDKPALVSAMYKNQRWSKYFMNIWLARNADYRLYFGQYLCRAWNGADVIGPERLANFEITYVREDTLLDGKVGEPKRVVIWSHHCFDSAAAQTIKMPERQTPPPPALPGPPPPPPSTAADHK